MWLALPLALSLPAMASPTVDLAGFATDTNGAPLSGTRTVDLALYVGGAPSAALTWSITTDFVDGAFAVSLTGIDPASVNLTGDLAFTLGIGGATSAPVPVGWAVRARSAAQADALSTSALTALDGRWLGLNGGTVGGDLLVTGDTVIEGLQAGIGDFLGTLSTAIDLVVGGDALVTGDLSVGGGGDFGAPVTVGAPTLGTHAATRDYVDDTVLAMAGGSGITTYDGAWFTGALNTTYTIAHNLGGLPRGVQVLWAPSCTGTGAEIVNGAADLVSTTTGNLVVNGNFASNNLSSWSVTAGSPAVQGPGTACTAGSYNIWATTAYTTYGAQQNIDVSAYAAAIDAGRASVTLSGCLLGNTSEGDVARVFARFLNTGGTEIGNTTINHNAGWTAKTASAAVPVNTRTVRIVIDTGTWASNNDNRITDIGLTLTQQASGFARGAAVYDISSSSLKLKSGVTFLNDGLATSPSATGCYRVSAFR